MEEFLNFLDNHLGVILCAVLALVQILLLIFKKNIKLDSVKEKILEWLPVCIRLTEDFKISGAEQKKAFCIELLGRFIKLPNGYDEFISKSIEQILSTPEKKGNTNGK